MLVIESNDTYTKPVKMTVIAKREGRRTLRIINLYRPNPNKGPFAGELLGSIVLSPEDAAELKRNL